MLQGNSPTKEPKKRVKGCLKTDKKTKETHSWNSMLMDAAEALAIVPNAVVERTMEVPSLEGLDTESSARSTILI